MPSMTATTMRGFVRENLDVDDSDLSDTLLNVWLRDAVIRIISFFDESPIWLQAEYTFNTVAGQQSYDLDTTVGLTSPAPLQAVDEVRGPLYSLSPASHRQIRGSYRTDAPSGRPQHFSQWGRSIYLWPKPSAVETFSLLGIRRPNWDWLTTTTAVPDIPEEFHILVAYWALSRAYAQQDDPEMANFYRQEFAGDLKNIAGRWLAIPTALPMVMNGGIRAEAYRTSKSLGPLIYDWE